MSTWHDDEPLFFRAKHLTLACATGFGGVGAKGGIHKVGVAQAAHIVALSKKCLAAATLPARAQTTAWGNVSKTVEVSLRWPSKSA